MLDRAKRQKTKVAVLFIDLDDFKRINDSLGHYIGDILLQEISKRFVCSKRKTDLLSRVGGDEFVFVMDDFIEVDYVNKVASKLIQQAINPFKINNHELFIGTSIGISIFPNDGETADDLIKYADAAMYLAKESGKNLYVFYEKSLQEKTEKILFITNELRKSLRDNDFILYYQPQISLIDNKVIGLESLIRWQHPRKGLLDPIEFIPIAESTGIIKMIDNWVLNQVSLDISTWNDMGLKSMKVSLNISSLEFYDQEFVKKLEECITKNKLTPENIEIEITENIFIDNRKDSIERLNQMKDIGISIAIDDFGTGYSNLSYLRNLPINTLKIDKLFVKNMIHCNKDKAIIKAIIELGKNLGLSVVAEGVEKEEQLEFLKNNGCDIVQGFLYSKPNDFDSISKYVGSMLKD